MTVPSTRLRAWLLCALVSLALLGGCASTGNPRDPLEPINRGIYHFNDGVDNLIVKPAAEIYRGVLPQVVRTGVSNFFSNISDVIVALNNLLQGKVTQAVSDVGRIVVNTTAGLLGVIDVATEIGLEKHQEDFGQTLGYWGIGDGPYLVIPFLGPSTLRDAVGLVGDWKTSPITYVDPTRDRNALYGLWFLNRRSELLETSKILETAALDPYEFVRDAYLQRRRNLVHDGNPPPEENDIEIKIKPKPDASKKAAPFAVFADENSGVGSIIVSGEPLTPAQLESLERAASSQTPQPAIREQRAEAAPETAARTRVVRVWLPTTTR
ncbi:MAG: VacJ family lipoprotein [Betaproteobacteria bacterium]|nr:VacJ family lipoprotein [Betaproteobacteria bacterium]